MENLHQNIEALIFSSETAVSKEDIVVCIQKLYPEWKGGYMCCDQHPVWLGGANWLGVGDPIIPAGMLSLRDIRGDYPKDAYGE